jgi:hypothetical protein
MDELSENPMVPRGRCSEREVVTGFALQILGPRPGSFSSFRPFRGALYVTLHAGHPDSLLSPIGGRNGRNGKNRERKNPSKHRPNFVPSDRSDLGSLGTIGPARSNRLSRLVNVGFLVHIHAFRVVKPDQIGPRVTISSTNLPTKFRLTSYSGWYLR